MLLVKWENCGGFCDSELFLDWQLLQPLWKSSRGAGRTELTGREILLGGGPKARAKLQKWQRFFCRFSWFWFIFVDIFFFTFPPQVRFWITWSQRLAVGPGSKFFEAGDASLICEATRPLKDSSDGQGRLCRRAYWLKCGMCLAIDLEVCSHTGAEEPLAPARCPWRGAAADTRAG